jgi:hypothetical protein
MPRRSTASSLLFNSLCLVWFVDVVVVVVVFYITTTAAGRCLLVLALASS